MTSREGHESDTAGDPAWWLRPTASLAKELSATGDGLSASEARSRLKRYGANQVEDALHRLLVQQFLHRFRNPLVLILIAASVVSAITGDVPSFGIIASMVLLSVTLDFIQEHRSDIHRRCWRRLDASIHCARSLLRPRAIAGAILLHRRVADACLPWDRGGREAGLLGEAEGAGVKAARLARAKRAFGIHFATKSK